MALRKNASLYISENSCIISICMDTGLIQFEDIWGMPVETLTKDEAEIFIEGLAEFVEIYNNINNNE